MELAQSAFSKRPKRFYSVNIAFVINKLISSMVNSVMFFITQVYKAVITSPPIRVDDTVRVTTRPRITPCSVALAQSGTISV